MTNGEETTLTIMQLFPTSTYEIKVVALSNSKDFGISYSVSLLVEESSESETIVCDTVVGSCAPEENKCCTCL